MHRVKNILYMVIFLRKVESCRAYELSQNNFYACALLIILETLSIENMMHCRPGP
jgi:hypothetical protein